MKISTIYHWVQQIIGAQSVVTSSNLTFIINLIIAFWRVGTPGTILIDYYCPSTIRCILILETFTCDKCVSGT